MTPNSYLSIVTLNLNRISQIFTELYTVYSSDVHNSQTVEGASVSFYRQMDKKDVYVYCEYHSAIRKDEYLLFTSTWMELEGIMLSEVSQSEKVKHYMVSFIWGI